MKGVRRFIGDRRGAAALEFALIGMPFILLMLGLIEFGRGLHIRNAVDSAADRAQRVILIDPAASDPAIKAEILSTFRAGQPDLLEITYGNDTISGVDFRTVTVSYPMNLLLPVPFGGSVSIGTTRRVAINH